MDAQTIGAAILAVFAVFQGVYGYSEKAEEAIKNLTDYQLLLPNNVSIGTNGTLKVALNAVPGAPDFWSDKVIQAAEQGYQVQLYALQEFKERANNLNVIVANMIEVNKGKEKDGLTRFEMAAVPIRIALEVISVINKIPVERFEVDKVKELVEKALSVIRKVLPDNTKDVQKTISQVQKQVEKLEKDLKDFQPDTIRKKCYPNVLCVANLLEALKTSVKKTENDIAKGEALIIQISDDVQTTMIQKISEEEEEISREAKGWAKYMLTVNSINKTTIDEHFLNILIKYNPVSTEIKELTSKAIHVAFQLEYFNELGRSLTKNSIMASAYPVIDAYTAVRELIRNFGGKVLGNELAEMETLVNQVYKDTLKITPDFSKEVEEFYKEIDELSKSIIDATRIQFQKEVEEEFIGDLLDYYLLYAGAIYEPIPQPLTEARRKFDELTKRIQAKLPVIKLAFERLQETIDIKVKKLHVEVMYDIANRLYKAGKVTHADIFWFGSSNINNTIRYWEPLVANASTRLERDYKVIQDKNYALYSIKVELVRITQTVLDALQSYTSIFGADVVAKRSVVVVQQLTTVPNADMEEVVAFNTRNNTDLYNSKVLYLNQLSVIKADCMAFIKQGVKTFPGTLAPFVEQSHYHSAKVYDTKLRYSRIVEALEKIRLQILSNEAYIIYTGEIILERIDRISKEYIDILNKYAELITKGQKFVADLPNILVVANRILRDEYGITTDEIPDFTEDIIPHDRR